MFFVPAKLGEEVLSMWSLKERANRLCAELNSPPAVYFDWLEGTLLEKAGAEDSKGQWVLMPKGMISNSPPGRILDRRFGSFDYGSSKDDGQYVFGSAREFFAGVVMNYLVNGKRLYFDFVATGHHDGGCCRNPFGQVPPLPIPGDSFITSWHHIVFWNFGSRDQLGCF